MILKIRTVYADQYYWKLLDNITEVNSRVVNKETRQNEKFQPDMYIQAIDEYGRVDQNNDAFKYIWCVKNGETYTICTNLIVYVLNDAGKTIEKI